MTQPQITVGILSGKEIEFSFPVKFSSSVGTEISGTQKVIYQDGKIHWQGKEYDELSFIPPQNAHAFSSKKACAFCGGMKDNSSTKCACFL